MQWGNKPFDFVDIRMEDIEQEFAGKGYGDFKVAVAEAVIEELKPLQERFALLMQDKAQLETLMKQGAEKASYVANRTLRKAMKKIGFVQV